MFNSISGTVTAKLPNTLFVENNGIEWDIMVPSRALDSFGLVGEQARVYVWLYHREDQMRLFGFPTTEERDIFLELTKVDGIGPKQAIRILSSIRPEDLEAALEGEDVARLSAAPGIGKKTAQKMILTLKGKLARDRGEAQVQDGGEHADIIGALADMGFDRKAAANRVAAIAAELAAGSGKTLNRTEREQEIFRRAIVDLSS